MRWAVSEPFVALKSSNILNLKAISLQIVWLAMLPKGKVSRPTGSHLRLQQQPWHSFEEFDNYKHDRQRNVDKGDGVRSAGTLVQETNG